MKVRAFDCMYRVLWLLATALVRVYCRFEVDGREHIPTDGAYVLAPVHRSNVDFLLAGLTGPRRSWFMAKRSIFVGGVIDWFLTGIGAFPVNREGVDRTALRSCEEHLAAGHPVVMFPEGRRQSGDRITECFEGPAFVASRQRVPIVPVGIGGSDRVMPIGSKLIFPRKVRIVVGEPIQPDVPVVGRIPRSTVTELTGELRDRLQELYDEARRLAGA